MNHFLWKHSPVSVLLLFLFASGTLFAQLPQCSLIYFDQYGISVVSSGKIFSYNPALPGSPTNPSLNTIATPGQNTYGLTVSEVLGSGNTTLTFYTVTDDTYWYYDPVTLQWVNTGHTTGSNWTGAFNIASGGGYIYNLSGLTGNVYVYDGTGNGSLLINIPDFVLEGPFDLIADCAGNFYILNVTGMNAPPYLRKYSHTGALLQSWTINNPNNYFVGNGGGMTAGFGIIGANIYVDNYDANGNKSIVQGTISATTVDFSGSSVPVNIAFADTLYPGDLGSCASGVPVTPEITITASATAVQQGTVVTFTSAENAGGSNPLYQWYVNGNPVPGANNSSYAYAPQDNDVIYCVLTSSLACVAEPTATSNAITIQVACAPVQMSYDPADYCLNGGFATPGFSPSGGTFTTTSPGLNLNAATGAVDLSNAVVGTYVIIYNLPAIGDCPAVTITDTISISANPEVAITELNDNMLCVNERVKLSATPHAGYNYKWTPDAFFRLGNNAATVTAIITGPGTIYVNLSNKGGCTAADSIYVNPITCCDVMVPNAFSPNGDGNNEVFRIFSGTTQKINQLSIYNRYGKRIFFTMDQDAVWDGRYNGQFVDQGVYYYYLSYVCSDGQVFVRKGDITMIR